MRDEEKKNKEEKKTRNKKIRTDPRDPRYWFNQTQTFILFKEKTKKLEKFSGQLKTVKITQHIWKRIK